MHSYNHNGIIFHYSPDLYDDVIINLNGIEFRIYGRDLLDFIVQCYIIPKQIEKLEQLKTEEFIRNL